MARITRVTAVPFGGTGTTDDFETFGSTAAGGTDFSKDIAAIQATAAWSTGWRAALIASKAPVLQDMNGAMLVFSNLQCYQFQEGVPEYDASTVYYKGGLVKYLGHSGYTEFYISLTDSNSGNSPGTRVSTADWLFLYALTTSSGLIIPGSVDGSSIPAGNVGEAFRAYQNSVNAAATGVWGNIASINLTPGDWDISGGALLSSAGATVAAGSIVALSAYSGNTTTDHLSGDNQLGIGIPTVSNSPGVHIASWRQTINANQTYYVKGFANYTGGPPQFYGRISARRWP